MKLALLQNHVADFGRKLQSEDGNTHLFKYDILSHFGSNWTFGTDDFAGMYDRSLESEVTRRWWKRESYRPKEVMLLLIRSEEQYLRQAFRQLADETRKVENRLDRFVFYCDEALRMYKRKQPKSIENNHYQDSAIISLYLAAIYPDRYTLYPGRLLFNRALLALGASGTGEKDDLLRFFTLARTVYIYLQKSIFITELIDRGLRPNGHLLLAHEFFLFVANAWDEVAPR